MKTRSFFTVILGCFLSVSAAAQQKPEVIRTKNTETLIPEGIVVDDKGNIYVSSINERKIIVIDKKGGHKDFIPSGHQKFLEGLGMKIDTKRNWLWVANNRHEGNTFTSQIHAFDMRSKKTEQYYVVTDTIPHLFNDIIIRDDGKVFFTDTYYSAVYSIEPATKKLEVVMKSPQLDYPNGLVFGPAGQLYIATYRNGLVMMDVASKKITPLSGFKDSTIAFALDGLVWWKNSLIGIYNIGPDRAKNTVIQYDLNKNGDAITQERILDAGHEVFFEPTTSALKGNKLYVLANSHLAAYNANKQSVKGVEDKLTPVAIVCYELK